ncbi:hypothetical protein LINPERHAP2_LOCUS37740 [Linum perenne]
MKRNKDSSILKDEDVTMRLEKEMWDPFCETELAGEG